MQDETEAVRSTPTVAEHTEDVGWAVHERALVATTGGDLTFTRARAMSREIERRLTPDIDRVILDISDVTAGTDAALLAGLLSVRTTLRRHDGELTIVAAGERLDRLVRVSALDDLLTIVPSLDQALPPLAAGTATTPAKDDVAA